MHPTSPEIYISHIPEDKKAAFEELRKVIKNNLPDGFEEVMIYGMIGYVIPKSIYPPGYHCDTNLPLPFIQIASQKNFIALYHMGLYCNESLLNWFTDKYKKEVPSKLDIGKSCIRFKKPNQIPYDLISELVSKMSVTDWITSYENNIKK